MDLGRLRELSEHRVCLVCGAEFDRIPATKNEPEIPVLWQFSDHLTLHNPTGEQWAEAHERIKAGKDRATQKPATADDVPSKEPF